MRASGMCCRRSVIARADIARVLVASLTSEAAGHETQELVA